MWDYSAQEKYDLLCELSQVELRNSIIVQEQNLTPHCLEHWNHEANDSIEAAYYCITCASLMWETWYRASVNKLHSNCDVKPYDAIETAQIVDEWIDEILM